MTEKIALFLRENLIGRQLHTDDVVYTLGEGRMKGTYTDTMAFSDLIITGYGLSFNMTTVTQEVVYEVGADGKCSPVENYTGTSVFNYRLAKRRSTDTMTGFMHCISASVRDQTMDSVVSGVSGVMLRRGVLRWEEQQLFYRDSPAGDGHYKPVAFDSSVRIYGDNGKTVFEYIPTFWDVDPVTMIKTLSADKYPHYISRER